MSSSEVRAAGPMVLPTRDDPLLRATSEVLGGPLGRRARVRDAAGGAAMWVPTVVLVALTTLSALLGLAAKEHCRASGWGTPDQYTHLCYSDVSALFDARGLSQGLVPYRDGTGDQVVEYPVLTGGLMWVTALLTPGDGPSPHRTVTYFDINLLFSFAFAAGAVVLTARTAGRRPWDAAMFAVAPGLILTATINWDMAAVLLTAAAFLAWARGRPTAAGVWLGLAVATKFYPVVLLGPLLVLCVRSGRVQAWWAAVSAAVIAWVAVDLPVMLVDFDHWKKFYVLSKDRTEGFSSIWLVLQHRGHGLGGHLNTVAELTLALLCVAIAWLGLAAPRRPRWPQLAFLTLAAFLLTNKVYSPQYVLWLIPLAVLARPRWRDFLVWQLTEVLHFVAIWLYLVGYTPAQADRALPSDWYDGAVLLHVAGTLWMCFVVVRDVWLPEHDVVRAPDPYEDEATGDDDPAGGVLDGAPDVVRLHGLSLRRPGRVEPEPAELTPL